MEYSDKLQREKVEVRELVNANITESVTWQKNLYHSGTGTTVSLAEGEKVLVNNPIHNKLEPYWTGPRIVQKIVDATSVRVKMETREQVVHINRIRPLLQEDSSAKEGHLWSPPLFTHTDISGTDEAAVSDHEASQDDSPPMRTMHSGLVIRPVDCYSYQSKNIIN